MLIDVSLYCNVKCDEMSCFLFPVFVCILIGSLCLCLCVRLEKWIFVLFFFLSPTQFLFFQNKMNVASISYEIVYETTATANPAAKAKLREEKCVRACVFL